MTTPSDPMPEQGATPPPVPEGALYAGGGTAPAGGGGGTAPSGTGGGVAPCSGIGSDGIVMSFHQLE